MGIGASIFLIAVGLILALAVNVNVSGIDINVIGWILVLVGIVGLAMTALIFAPRRRAVREQTVVRDTPIVQERTTRDEY